MSREDVRKYMDFMRDPGNVRKCSMCPENRNEPYRRNLPCGQQNCWVRLHVEAARKRP
jgi:hypothetical protein